MSLCLPAEVITGHDVSVRETACCGITEQDVSVRAPACCGHYWAGCECPCACFPAVGITGQDVSVRAPNCLLWALLGRM